MQIKNDKETVKNNILLLKTSFLLNKHKPK